MPRRPSRKAKTASALPYESVKREGDVAMPGAAASRNAVAGQVRCRAVAAASTARPVSCSHSGLRSRPRRSAAATGTARPPRARGPLLRAEVSRLPKVQAPTGTPPLPIVRVGVKRSEAEPTCLRHSVAAPSPLPMAGSSCHDCAHEHQHRVPARSRHRLVRGECPRPAVAPPRRGSLGRDGQRVHAPADAGEPRPSRVRAVARTVAAPRRSGQGGARRGRARLGQTRLSPPRCGCTAPPSP